MRVRICIEMVKDQRSLVLITAFNFSLIRSFFRFLRVRNGETEQRGYKFIWTERDRIVFQCLLLTELI